MKKIYISCIAAGVGVLMSANVFADGAVILDEKFDDIEAWATKSSCFSAKDGKLNINTQNIAGEQSIYKYNSTNAKSYLRTVIGTDYEVTTDIQIHDAFEGDIENGYCAGITVINGQYEMTMYITKNGLYAKTDSGMEKYDIEIDGDIHSYKISVDDEYAAIGIDEEILFDWEMPANTGKDDIKILSKGSESDKVIASVDNVKLMKIYDTRVLFDDMTTFDKTYDEENLECATYEAMFFGGKAQVDMVDPTVTGSVIYKLPEGSEMTGFTVSVRKHPQNQADVYIALSKDGVSWTRNYTHQDFKYTWFYANGGHRYLITPGTIPVSGMSYMKIILVPNIGGSGGAASESSPSIMCTEIYYTIPEFIDAEIEGKKLSNESVFSANATELTLNFTAVPEAESVLENVILKCNGKEVEKDVEVVGNSAVLKFSEYLDFGEEFTLDICKGLKSQNGAEFDSVGNSYTFKTYESDFKMENVVFIEENEEISAKAEITNTSGRTQTITLIIIGYRDGMMTGFNSCEKTVKHLEKVDVISGFIASDAEKIEVMLWNNLKDMTALVPNYIK